MSEAAYIVRNISKKLLCVKKSTCKLFYSKSAIFDFEKNYKLRKSQHICFCIHVGMPASYTFKDEPFTYNFFHLSLIQNVLRISPW